MCQPPPIFFGGFVCHVGAAHQFQRYPAFKRYEIRFKSLTRVYVFFVTPPAKITDVKWSGVPLTEMSRGQCDALSYLFFIKIGGKDNIFHRFTMLFRGLNVKN